MQVMRGKEQRKTDRSLKFSLFTHFNRFFRYLFSILAKDSFGS